VFTEEEGVNPDGALDLAMRKISREQ